MQQNTENVIIVKSKTRLEQLTEKFNTQAQAKFYIQQSETNFATAKSSANLQSKSKLANNIQVKQRVEPINSSFDDYQNQHDNFFRSLDLIQKKISSSAKVKIIDRSFLANFVFSENDIVIVLGQDGLVANTAKYVNNIPIIGINPEPSRYDGILLPFNVTNFEDTFYEVLEKRYQYKLVTMAEAKLNDGQRLLAFNDLFIGPSTHISARYKITYNSISENHSSSGVIVSTGAGSTGWLSSMFNMAAGISRTFYSSNVQIEQKRMEWDTAQLIFVVREPFLSKYSQTNLAAGIINQNSEFILESLMPENGVIFSDGIEADFIKFNSGAIATIGIANEKAKLVINSYSNK
jgi:NAD kinase